jgi:hypothetical protein
MVSIQSLRRCLCLISALLFLPTLLGCLDDRPLVGGYRLKYMNGCEVRLFPEHTDSFRNKWVDGSVQSYAVRGPFITGYPRFASSARSALPSCWTIVPDMSAFRNVARGGEKPITENPFSQDLVNRPR